MWISPRARKPTWACIHRSVPTIGFMSTDHRNPAGYTIRLTRPAPARPTSRRTPPMSRRSAPLTAERSASRLFDWRGTVLRVFAAAWLMVFRAAFFFFAICPRCGQPERLMLARLANGDAQRASPDERACRDLAARDQG